MDTKTQDAIDKRLAEYALANSWWQKYRRAHPLAVQNACLALGIVLGVGLGRLWGWLV